MHAYLILGSGKKEVSEKIAELAEKLKVKTIEFPLSKIEEARSLNSFLKLKITGPTAIIINSIDEATEEASSAFLKNLEEPQEDLYYFLSAKNIHKVLPTIVSRSQVITTLPKEGLKDNSQTSKFLEMSVGEKLGLVDQIRGRDEARDFVQDIINFLHASLHKDNKNLTHIADNIELSQKILGNLSANGNVVLQLTNLVVNLK